VEAFAAYEAAYRSIRSRYGWTDEPAIYRGSKPWQINELVPPRWMSSEVYGRYFGEVMELYPYYEGAAEYGRRAALKRPPAGAAESYQALLGTMRAIAESGRPLAELLAEAREAAG
jgi:hypothetical protein